MVEVPPIATLAGSDEHEITGGRASFTVNLALQEATPFLLPSLKLAVIWYGPGDRGRSIRRKVPIWEQADLVLPRALQPYTGQQSLPAVLLEPD